MSRSPSKKILVIEDDPEVMEMVRLILRTKGYEIHTSPNAEDGLDMFFNLEPDLVISDLRLPGMSGMELCKRIRKEPILGSTPILIISGLAANSDKSEAFWATGLGCDDFLTKPFDPLGLLGRVEYLLRKQEYVSEAREPEAPVDQDTSWMQDPVEVVWRFVESWNHQDFGTEFDCMGEEMLGGVRRKDYIERRLKSFSEDHGATHHGVIDAEVLKSSEHVVTVACLRDDTVRGTSRRKDERYTLKRTSMGWKIVNVRSRSMNYSME